MDKEINFITFVGINIEKQMRSQHTFKTSAGSLTGCSKPATKHQILNAAILQVLNMVNKNHSFSSANGGSDRFKKCSRTRKLLRSILKKKQNPNMLFNLVSLALLKMN